MVGELINTFLKHWILIREIYLSKDTGIHNLLKLYQKELGKSESSVKVALHRLRKDLKKFLESEGVLV